MLKDIGMAIITKCDCLPLAVKVIGGLLRQKRTIRRDWEKVLNDSMWSTSQMPEELNFAIHLSYDDLHPSLKPCFLYCSLLPKGTVFMDHDIVGMWISEGFVHGNSHDLEETGKEYYDELIQRNLIEPDIKNTEQIYNKNTEQQVCNIHDVVRSFAQYVARNEALVTQNSDDFSGKLNSRKFIRLSLETRGSDSSELEWCSLQAQTSLRTLISVGRIKMKPGDSLLAFSNLRTLHIEDANFDALSESLNQLKHLRYLSIKRTSISSLPENIGKMKFLQYISLYGSYRLAKLPCSIANLQHLRYLNLDETTISDVPRGFNGLTYLRKLYGFPAHIIDGNWCSLEELGPLSQLTWLHLCGLGNVCFSSFATAARLGEKVHLRYLCLEFTYIFKNDGRINLIKEQDATQEEQRQVSGVLDELCPPRCLEILEIIGYFGQRLPRWMTSTVMSVGTLRILKFVGLYKCTELPNGLCQLPFLELLQFVRALEIKHVGPEFVQPIHHCHNPSQVGATFPRLHVLYFDRLVSWEEWEWEEQVRAMALLEELRIDRCWLKRVPPGLAFQARALKKLYIYDVRDLSSLENFTSVVHLKMYRNTDMERISNLPSLQKLEILKCPKMKVLEAVPALQRIKLGFNISTLPGYFHHVRPKHLLIYCGMSLLLSIAAGKSSPEWVKFRQIQQVKAYADDHDTRISREWYVMYTRDPLRFETNLSRSDITQARKNRTWFAYAETCPIDDEWRQVGRCALADKRLPLCVRFRWQAYAFLVPWLRQACLHCSEANRIASSSDQWIEPPRYPAGISCLTRYGWLQRQKERPRV